MVFHLFSFVSPVSIAQTRAEKVEKSKAEKEKRRKLRKKRREKIKKKKENADEEAGEVLIRKNIQISEEVNTFAEEIDMFLSGDDYSSKDNESSLVVVNQFDYSEFV